MGFLAKLDICSCIGLPERFCSSIYLGSHSVTYKGMLPLLFTLQNSTFAHAFDCLYSVWSSLQNSTFAHALACLYSVDSIPAFARLRYPTPRHAGSTVDGGFWWEFLRRFGRVWEDLGALPPTEATACVAADLSSVASGVGGCRLSYTLIHSHIFSYIGFTAVFSVYGCFRQKLLLPALSLFLLLNCRRSLPAAVLPRWAAVDPSLPVCAEKLASKSYMPWSQ